MRDNGALARQAAAQHGLLTRRQLDEMGWTTSAIRNLVARGTLDRLSRGVFVVVGAVASREQEIMRACIASSPWAVASHRTALRLWGLRSVDDDIDVSVRYPRDSRTELAAVHRSRDLRSSDITWIEGIPVTTPARTLCDAGLLLPGPTVRRLVDHALALGIVSLSQLQSYRRRVGRPGRNGAGVLRQVLADRGADHAGADSGPEVELRRLLRLTGVHGGVPQHPVKAGGKLFRIDLAFPADRVAVEFDGFAVHTAPDRFVDDRRRQNALLLAGWTVLRFTNADLRERPSAVAAEIRTARTAGGL